jgi:hypothetical protein
MFRFVRQERAQVLALVALLATALLGFTGLVIDGGVYFSERRQTQNGSDNAALAAAFALYFGGSPDDIDDAALDYAEANGYDADQVTVHHPPVSGPHTGDPEFIEIEIEDEPSTFFIHVLLDASTVKARGVAGVAEYPDDYALIVLNESACQAYYQEGTADFTINGGGVMVNSDCEPNAFRKTGTGDLTVDGDIHVHGAYTISGAGSVAPTPEEVYWTVPDPLADVTPPTRGAPTACPTGGTGTAAVPDTCVISGPTNRTLNPGTYYGGLDIRCVCTVTMNPGVYVMSGGGFTKSGGAQIVGDEVMIYVTTNPTNPTGDGSPEPFDFSGAGQVDLDPITDPTSPYYGLGFWQDAAITSDFYLSGNVSSSSGIFYVPGAEMDIAGVSALNGVQIVTDRFNVRGTTSLELNYQSWVDVLVPKVYLVE